MKLQTLQDAQVMGKKVLLRLDTDVPLSETGEILDTTRLTAGLETIRRLLSHQATVIICGHLGRPKGKVEPSMSMAPVGEWFAHTLHTASPQKTQLGDFDGWKLSENLFMVENLRFYPGEEENDETFAKQLASLAQVYVDDAFAVSHRSAASNVGITKFLPSYAGIQLQKEVEGLGKVLENPARPLVVIIGGAKLETKVPLVSKMHAFADYVLVGGKLVQETDVLQKAIREEGKAEIIVAKPAPSGLDISPQSAAQFSDIIQQGKTIVWNGPVGKTDGDADSLAGSRAVASAMLSTDAYTVIGGGDSIEFLDREKILGKFSFVSTGGGAMLSFLSGEPLPALIPLSA